MKVTWMQVGGKIKINSCQRPLFYKIKIDTEVEAPEKPGQAVRQVLHLPHGNFRWKKSSPGNKR
jgi:hypothetical protein